MKKQISIIGCGWLGFPLAKNLVDKGYKVKGSSTSEEKLKTISDANIEAFHIQLNEDGIVGEYTDFLKGSETVIINIPPGLRKNPDKNHVVEIQHLVNAIETQTIKNVIYISSTSVFEDETHFPIITANSAPNATSLNGKQLITIENILKENTNFNTTIIRFGGLFDSQRHPAKYLAGRTNLSNPEAPVNLIHKEDCINIITLILRNNIWNETFNAAHPNHPTKKGYYTNYCKQHQLDLPQFNTSEKSKGKIIESTKLEQLLNYSFKQAL
ncbi:MAG: NAD(P)H-binding protein [Flavobacteriaceae bacterium]|nr:NAD(P)H-binding protein [Flavobacteriaceae bacterium]